MTVETAERWADAADMEEYDCENLAFLLPPRQVVGPDENNIKKVTEYKLGDNGNMVKVTTTTHVTKAYLSKRAVERQSWDKFGDAVNDDVGSSLTKVSTEEIFLQRAPGSKQEEIKASSMVLKLCRTCGKKGDHWTARCPYRDLTKNTLSTTDSPPCGGSTSNVAYVAPCMRANAELPAGGGRWSGMMPCRNDENRNRVTNSSEGTREADLHELFGTFGQVTRVYVATDQNTGTSRGFGFVNFAIREDAEMAIDRLNGYGYDNLILRVEWDIPRVN